MGRNRKPPAGAAYKKAQNAKAQQGRAGPASLQQRREQEVANKTTFSLADEARWNSNHRSAAFDTTKKLRFLKIEFVSAGMLEGTLKQQPPPPAQQAAIAPAAGNHAPTTFNSSSSAMRPDKQREEQTAAPNTVPKEQMQIPHRPKNGHTGNRTQAGLHAAPQFPVPDPVQNMAFRPKEAAETTQVPNPGKPIASHSRSSSMSSSEDEVVFRGRGNPPAVRAAPSTNKATPRETLPVYVDTAQPVSSSVAAERVEPVVLEASGPVTGVFPVEPANTSTNVIKKESDSDCDIVVPAVFEKRLAGQSPWMLNSTPWESRSVPGIGWLPVKDRPHLVKSFNRKVPLAPAPNMDAFWHSQENPAAAALEDYMQNLRDDIASNAADPDDSDDLDEQAHAAAFDVKMDSDGDDSIIFPDTGDSDDSIVLDDSDLEDDDSEDDDLEKYDDARIARVLQKQADLGMDTDELVLFAGDERFDVATDVLPSDINQRFNRPADRRRNRNQGTSSGAQPAFPSASALADALDMDPYNGFDVMDTDRPSLRPVKKGRRGQMPPELSDSDLNEQIQSSWTKDRAKKRVKKAEREELRKQGLLGRNGKPADLAVKYSESVTMDDIIEEIRNFMSGNMNSLSLPPMEAHRRAVVHQMVNQIGVNSKSHGVGKTRFTVLTKTSRTKVMEDSFYDALLKRKTFQRRFQNEPMDKPDRSGRPKARPQLGYKDGDTVGATAPELGPENKGHALLKKMGWTKGMALGAIDNKGIMQPIAHVVKTGKAGLK